jgi:hypothetical protein
MRRFSSDDQLFPPEAILSGENGANGRRLSRKGMKSKLRE